MSGTRVGDLALGTQRAKDQWAEKPVLEHVELRVADLGLAKAFFCDTLGLACLDATADRAYLTCGSGPTYDLALLRGGQGVAHFAIVVAPDQLDAFGSSLRAAGVTYESLNYAEPGECRSLRFPLPGGQIMELVVVDEPSATKARSDAGVCPVDLDHIQLMASDPRAVCMFLVDVLGFRLSAFLELERGSGHWPLAFTRRSNRYHDVVVAKQSHPRATLHHIAWQMSSFEHLKRACDAVVADGGMIELGVGRHKVGSNLFAYCVTPGSNRIELTAEMETVDDELPTLVGRRWEQFDDLWGPAVYPASWERGT